MLGIPSNHHQPLPNYDAGCMILSTLKWLLNPYRSVMVSFLGLNELHCNGWVSIWAAKLNKANLYLIDYIAIE